MTKRLTEKAAERARAKARTYALGDAKATGLSLRVFPTGKKVWVLQLAFPGHDTQSRRTLGIYPAMGLKAAREKATEWYALVKNDGRDPQEVEAEKARAAAAERQAQALKDATTFAAVAERFIAEHVARQRRGKAGAREVRNYLIKAWGERPISSITPQDVKTLIGKLKTTAPYQARNVLGHAGVLFRWCVHNDLLSVSPTASLSKKWLLSGAQIGPRQRVLDDDELGVFWRATGKLGYPMGDVYRLLLLTGCRVNEVAKAKWRELNPNLRRAIREGTWRAVPAENRVLTIPAERFKSNAAHVVPLSDDALEIIARLPRWSGSADDYLFTTTGGRKAVNGMSKSKKQLDELMLLSLKAMAQSRGEDPNTVTLKPFIIHDTRRCVRSHLSALDVPDHVAELCLGHGRRGLQRVYDQHRYLDQQRDALGRWAERLRGIVEPVKPAPAAPNVVALKRKARRA
jgi:integrase